MNHMDTPQETKELKTPTGEHTILIKSFLTGEDRRANRRLILKINDDGKGETVEGIEEAEDGLIKQIVLKVDDSEEDIIPRILKFKAEDYDFVFKTITDISQGLDKKKESTSSGSTNPSSEEQKLD